MAAANPPASASPNAPATKAVAVTPADGADLTLAPCRSLWIGGAGNVQVTMQDGNTAVFIGCTAGSTLPVCAKRVWSTSTTATSILALY